ncbi:putative Allantoicase [Glarea lozoyensis 74030]|uniref:Putative Allantoicase n=1 Tax=Glarea lozoyensis (strain ATCC 74030 / MF5533) TaxID=1104152 RepID=H0EU28_GLAL7|nr:putative Allantoicase [Glarea lozoyensis 74030]
MPRELYPIDDVPTKSIATEEIDSILKSKFLDLISAPLGGTVLDVSDEWFAPATNLLSPKTPIYSERQVFTGQWMDGWESRRHNRKPFDYVIIRLGVASGSIVGVEIDTAYFQGNEAPAISVEACFATNDSEVVGWKGERAGWETVVGRKECGPSKRHAWMAEANTKPYTHVRLNMYPDGGTARFRLYGVAIPILPDEKTVCDLAAATNGGMAADQIWLMAGRLLDLGLKIT